MTRQEKISATLIMLCCLSDSPVHAAEIFRWVDAEGVVHFSDTAPKSSTSAVARITVDAANSPDYVPGNNEHAILRQAERISARYEELKARREARNRSRQETAMAQADQSESRARYEFGYRRPYFVPWQSRHRPAAINRAARRESQLATLDRLGLDRKRRPHSINSSAHQRRISASSALLEPATPGTPH